jgi:hypothetical protein
MEKVQRLNVCGSEKLINFNDGLRYSLVPFKYLEREGINVAYKRSNQNRLLIVRLKRLCWLIDLILN